MDYESNYGEKVFQIFPDEPPMLVRRVYKNTIIAIDDTKNNKIFVCRELSDVNDKEAKNIEEVLNNLHEFSISSDFSSTDGNFRLVLSEIDIFTTSRQTASTLFKYGARSCRMATIEDNLSEYDGFYLFPDSTEATLLADEIIYFNQNENDDLDYWMNFANKNTYRTSFSRQVFSGWVELLFVESFCGLKIEERQLEFA